MTPVALLPPWWTTYEGGSASQPCTPPGKRSQDSIEHPVELLARILGQKNAE
jgi:hypothetical protein